MLHYLKKNLFIDIDADEAKRAKLKKKKSFIKDKNNFEIINIDKNVNKKVR